MSRLGVQVSRVGDDGHHFRSLDGYDTSMVAYVGPYWPGPDAEAVAALEPDLIIANPWVEGAYETYSEIAPTVIMDPNAKPMNESLMDFADVVGRMDRAKELGAEYEAAAATLREELGDKLQTTTISIMEYWVGEMSAPPNAQSLSLAVPGLGMIRTPYQQAKAIDDWSAMSPEILGEDDADIMILIAAPDAQIGDMTPAVEEFMSNPLVGATEVAQAGQVFPVNARKIYGTSWGQAIDAMEAFAEIIGQDGLNRDLVIE